MAGSLNHIVDDDGSFTMDLIENLGTGLLDDLPVNLWAEGPTYAGAPIHGPCFVAGFQGEDLCDISVRQVATYSMLKRPKRYDFDRQALVFE